MDEPSPAPRSTSTSCPARISSVTPAGVSATRYSRFFTSRATPTHIVRLLVPAGRLPRVTGRPPRRGPPGRGGPRPESRSGTAVVPGTGPGGSRVRAACGGLRADRRWPPDRPPGTEDVDAPVRPTPRPAPAPGPGRRRTARLDGAVGAGGPHRAPG